MRLGWSMAKSQHSSPEALWSVNHPPSRPNGLPVTLVRVYEGAPAPHTLMVATHVLPRICYVRCGKCSSSSRIPSRAVAVAESGSLLPAWPANTQWRSRHRVLCVFENAIFFLTNCYGCCPERAALPVDWRHIFDCNLYLPQFVLLGRPFSRFSS